MGSYFSYNLWTQPILYHNHLSLTLVSIIFRIHFYVIEECKIHPECPYNPVKTLLDLTPQILFQCSMTGKKESIFQNLKSKLPGVLWPLLNIIYEGSSCQNVAFLLLIRQVISRSHKEAAACWVTIHDKYTLFSQSLTLAKIKNQTYTHTQKALCCSDI